MYTKLKYIFFTEKFYLASEKTWLQCESDRLGIRKYIMLKIYIIYPFHSKQRRKTQKCLTNIHLKSI